MTIVEIEKEINERIGLLNSSLKAKRDIIYKALSENKEIVEQFKISHAGGQGRYKSFFWINLERKDTGKKYAISVLSSDIDPDSGNIHTLLGTVQFSSLEEKITKKGNCRYGSNIYCETKKKWLFLDENYKEFTHSPADRDYFNKLIKQFLKFTKRHES